MRKALVLGLVLDSLWRADGGAIVTCGTQARTPPTTAAHGLLRQRVWWIPEGR